jgi:hypothetical protein
LIHLGLPPACVEYRLLLECRQAIVFPLIRMNLNYVVTSKYLPQFLGSKDFIPSVR